MCTGVQIVAGICEVGVQGHTEAAARRIPAVTRRTGTVRWPRWGLDGRAALGYGGAAWQWRDVDCHSSGGDETTYIEVAVVVSVVGRGCGDYGFAVVSCSGGTVLSVTAMMPLHYVEEVVVVVAV